MASPRTFKCVRIQKLQTTLLVKNQAPKESYAVYVQKEIVDAVLIYRLAFVTQDEAADFLNIVKRAVLLRWKIYIN